nr:MAG TPA: hypothetical protein [Bacteriophage sp.]
MDAVRYLKERMRMCHSFGNTSCGGCPIYAERGILTCTQFQNIFPGQIVEIVEKWAKEHQRETRLTEFLKHYPNALMEDDGTPEVCVNELGLKRDDGCISNCIKCWNRPLEEE